MKKLLLIALVLIGLDICAQSQANLIRNWTITKDSIFGIDQPGGSSVWSIMVTLKNPNGYKNGTVSVVASNDNARWDQYSSSMVKAISSMSYKVSGRDTTFYVIFTDFNLPTSYIGVKFTKNSMTHGVLNAILVQKKL